MYEKSVKGSALTVLTCIWISLLVLVIKLRHNQYKLQHDTLEICVTHAYTRSISVSECFLSVVSSSVCVVEIGTKQFVCNRR